MKLPIIAVMALLILGAGAVGVYLFFDTPAEASAGALNEAAIAKHEEKSAKAGDAQSDTSEYVEMDVLVLPIIGERGVTQMVSLVISLEVPDAETAELVRRLSPRLKDAYIQEMYGTLNRTSGMRDGVVHVGYIKERLNRTSEHVLGEGKIQDVLLQVVQQRSL